jgi:hypothetical protein
VEQVLTLQNPRENLSLQPHTNWLFYSVGESPHYDKGFIPFLFTINNVLNLEVTGVLLENTLKSDHLKLELSVQE